MTHTEKEVAKALDLVRIAQVDRFMSQMAGMVKAEADSHKAAVRALKKHGSKMVTLQFTCETACLLSHILSRRGAFSQTPELEQIRLNVISAMANTVERVDPTLVSIATGMVDVYATTPAIEG